MAIVLVCFYTQNSLHDFKLYTRKFYPSQFESDSRVEYSNGRLFLVLSQEKHRPAPSLFDCTPELCVCNQNDQNDNNSTEDGLEMNSKTKTGTFECCCLKRQQQRRKQESYFQLCPTHQACLTLDSHAASCAAHELALSRIFRKKFFMYAKSKAGFSGGFNNVDGHEDVGLIWIPYVIEVQLEFPKQKIDFSWYYRIQGLVILKVQTEESMALLSTLGGGFSALGDYDQRHSLEAGKIAMRQLKIATTICDPLVAARCYLYVSLSLMQRGFLQEAQMVIRKQYSFAKSHFIQDSRLTQMCKGVWARLQFMYYLRRLERQGIPCSIHHGILADYYASYNKCNIWPPSNGQDEARIRVHLGIV